ncbi:hypothetical protein TNCV_5102861, partial [Trichonephila clavipes]
MLFPSEFLSESILSILCSETIGVVWSIGCRAALEVCCVVTERNQIVLRFMSCKGDSVISIDVSGGLR